MNDPNTEAELPRITRPIATLLPTVLDRRTTGRTASIGVVSPFVGLLNTRIPLSVVSLDLPTLSYLLTGWVGDVSQEAGRSPTDSGRLTVEPSSPERPKRSRDRDVRTAVREFVRVWETDPSRDRGTRPAADEPGRAGGGVGSGDVSAFSDQSTTPSSMYSEWTVVNHGIGAPGATLAEEGTVSDGPSGSSATPHIPGVSNGPRTLRTTTRPPTVRSGRSPLLVDHDRGEPSTIETTATKTVQRPDSDLTVRLDTVPDGTSDRSSTATRRSESGNGRGAGSSGPFGPPIDLTVRRHADRNRGQSAADGRKSSPVDLATAGGRRDHPGTPQSRPEQRTDQAGTPSPLFDLSRASPAEVDRLVDRLYGEMTRRHRIERERRGR